MNFSKLFIGLAATGLLSSSLWADNLTPTDANNMVNFLTSNADTGAGFAYLGTAKGKPRDPLKSGSLMGKVLPMSYYSTADYWAKYVCNTSINPENHCEVEDALGTDWSLSPDGKLPGGDLQYERINVFNGTDIYDAATWQIAIALAAKDPAVNTSFDLAGLADNENDLLEYGFDGNSSNPKSDANRGNTSSFTYNKIAGANIPAQNAYVFRMVTRNWLSTDPFMTNPDYLNQYIHILKPPLPNDYRTGNVSWADWKPITGENAWAFLIGPLQAAYLKYGSADKIPLDSDAVQHALNVLNTFREMQSAIGAVYYGPKGMDGNQGGAINPYEVSTENNASLLAGLLMLQQILTAHGKPNSTIQTMIYGGNGTAGILSYFKNNAWNPKTHTFYQGGLANQPGQADWVPNEEPQAVDVNTWTVTVLGQPLIDSWFGAGTANIIWQNVKTWGGFYGPDNTLWGVGYSDQDGNGGGQFNKKGILSAEWTAGAINMVEALMKQYGSSNPAYPGLKNDFDNMTKNIMSLRTDQYTNNANAFPEGISNDFKNLVPIPSNKLGFLYASKRFAIPFGWNANPLPSTCSTSWMLMRYYDFNPFSLGGNFTPNFPLTAKKNTQGVTPR